jgi:hypothetical protein
MRYAAANATRAWGGGVCALQSSSFSSDMGMLISLVKWGPLMLISLVIWGPRDANFSSDMGMLISLVKWGPRDANFSSDIGMLISLVK